MKHLVIATHPDDETLGCGGTILRAKECGDSIHWCIMTRAASSDTRVKQAQEDTVHSVYSAYGFASLRWLDFSSTTLDALPQKELINAISSVVQEVMPDILYLPFWGDAHSDHLQTFNAGWSNSKVFRYPYIRRILCMEVLSETNFSPVHQHFTPNFYAKISPVQFKRKLKILSMYESELSEHPFPRSLRAVEALGVLRGSEAGCEYAESFMLLKEIQ